MSTSDTSNRNNRQQEQHQIIFVDRAGLTPSEDDLHLKQQWIDIYNESLSEGAVRSNGTILWDCPCLGTQAIGPCSSQFRTAFSCYQTSTKEPKGSECMMEFMKMQSCFTQFPKLYNNSNTSKMNENSDETKLNTKLMGHPEARRQRLIEERNRRIKNREEQSQSE